MNQSRLLMLAHALEYEAERKSGFMFDLSLWLSSAIGIKPRNACGTTGCAVGLAMVLPQFNDAGLTAEPEPHHGHFEPAYKIKASPGKKAETIHGWEAVQHFFEINDPEDSFLFDPESYSGLPITGPDGMLAVADRIRRFVDGSIPESEIIAAVHGDDDDEPIDW